MATLGQAWVGISPDLGGFATKAAAGIKAALKGAGGDVSVGANVSGAAAAIAALKALISRSGLADFLDINVPVGKIQAQLQLLRRLLNQSNITDILGIDVDKSKLTAQLAEISKLSESIPVSFDVSRPDISALTETITVAVNDAAARAEILADTRPRVISVTEAITQAIAGGSNIGVGSFTETPAGAGGGAAAGGGGDDGGAVAAGAAASSAGRSVAAFTGILGTSVGAVKLWHLALDAAVESVIAVGLAAAAAATGLAAMASTAIDVYNHIVAVNDVNSAFGDQINVLGGSFRSFAEGVQNSSQVLEIYGGALNAVSGKTSVFATVGQEVVTLVDDWIAKIDIWSQSQNGMGKLLQSGVGFLSQFAAILANVGKALVNLVAADPGTAHFLLDIIDGASKLLDWVTKLPAPLILTGLALHSVYLWGNAASGLLGKLVLGFSKMFGGLSAVDSIGQKLSSGFDLGFLFTPWGAAATVAAAGIGFLVYQMLQVPAAAQKVDTATSALLSGNTTNFIASFGAVTKQAMTQMTVAVQAQQNAWKPYNIAIHSAVTDAGSALDDFVHLNVVGGFKLASDAVNKSGTAFADFWTGAIGGQQEQNAIDHINSDLASLVGAFKTVDQETGVLVKQGFSVSQSWALMDLAGVQAGDHFDVMEQKVENLIAGYQGMSVQGGLLAGSVDTITFAAEQQSSKITDLTGSYTTWFDTISGGVSSLDGFAQQMAALDKSYGLNTSNLGMLNATQAAAQSQFVTTTGAAQTQYNSLVTLASAAGLGSKGTAMLTSAMNDYMTLLIPAAKNNTALQSTLVGMYQEVNQNVKTFPQLEKAVGDVKDPMDKLDSTTTQLTKDAGGLTKDVQDLATALHQTLDGAMADAILAASGGQTAFTNFAKSVLGTGDNITAMQKPADTLIASLIKSTGSASTAQQAFYQFAIGGLHLTAGEATALWNNFTDHGIPTTTQLGNNATTAKGKFADWAKNGLDLSTTSANSLWTKLTSQLGPYMSGTLANTVLASQGTFEKWAGKGGASGLGLSQAQAASLYGELKTLQGFIDTMHGTNLPISVGLSAEGGMELRTSGPVGEVEKIEFAALAGGGRLGGFGGGDQVPALLEPGETVVDKMTTRKFASVLRAMGVPGFAAGGVAGLTGGLSAAQGTAGRDVESVTTAALNAELTAVMSQVTAATKAAMAAQAAAVSGGISSAGVSNASAEMALASAANKMGWGGSQWAALYDVEMREAGFSLTATNPTSGAYGMAQFINGPSEYAQYGGNATTAAGQATAMVNYIAQRYGNPQAAWNHELAYGWYDQGGWLPPGASMAINNTGQAEKVTPGGKLSADAQYLGQKIDVLVSVMGQQGGKFATSLNSLAGAAGSRGSYSTRR